MIHRKSRNWYYKILRVAMRELAMSEDDYRAILEGFGAKLKNGKVSATTMSIPQLEQTLMHMRSLGFKIKRTKQKSFKEGQLNKIEKLWGSLFEAGVMHQPYSPQTISKFAYRITGVNQIAWANPTQLAKVIEALKAVAKRERVLSEADSNT